MLKFHLQQDPLPESGKKAVSRIDGYEETASFKKEFVINLNTVYTPDHAQQKKIITDLTDWKQQFLKDNPQPETNLNGLDSTV